MATPLVVFSLWSDRGIRAAWEARKAFLGDLQPPAVCLHAWPGKATTAVAKEVRALLPEARLWLGAGWNPIARRLRAGSSSIAQSVAMAVGIARGAADLGVEALVVNAEGGPDGGWKSDEGTIVRRTFDQAAREQLAAIRSAYHSMPLVFTSHDIPDYHATMNFPAWLGPDSPVDLHAPQVYPAPCWSVASAKARRNWADAQWRKWSRLGRIAARYAPGGNGYITYQQVANVCTDGIVAIATMPPQPATVLFWGEHMDQHGEAALRRLLGRPA